MKPDDIVGETVERERQRAKPLVPTALATFRQSIDSKSTMSAVTNALSDAVVTLTPSSRVGFCGISAANSNHADWHLLRQILAEGPSYLYITPTSLNSLEDEAACSIELLAFLAECKLMIPLLQRRSPQDWADWKPKTPAHLKILEAAIAPGEATDLLLAGLLPNAEERRANLRRGLAKFEPIANPKEVFYDLTVHNIDGMLNAMAFRIALLEAIGRPSVERYDHLIGHSTPSDEHAKSIHDGVMFEYRTICGRAFTSFGGAFTMLGWAWKKLVDMRALSVDSTPTFYGDPQDMIRCYEEALDLPLHRFEAIDWEVARDPSAARVIIASIELMMKAGYWIDLRLLRETQIPMEGDLNAKSSNFYNRLPQLTDYNKKYHDVLSRSQEPLEHLPRTDRLQATAALATGDAIALSDLGSNMGTIRPDVGDESRSFIANEVVSLFEDCKDSIRVVRERILRDVT